LPENGGQAARERKVVAMATRQIGRSAVTGKFMPVKAAQSPARRNTAIVQTIKSKPSKKR
jgi:hypothetical protein